MEVVSTRVCWCRHLFVGTSEAVVVEGGGIWSGKCNVLLPRRALCLGLAGATLGTGVRYGLIRIKTLNWMQNFFITPNWYYKYNHWSRSKFMYLGKVWTVSQIISSSEFIPVTVLFTRALKKYFADKVHVVFCGKKVWNIVRK